MCNRDLSVDKNNAIVHSNINLTIAVQCLKKMKFNIVYVDVNRQRLPFKY